MIIIGDLLGISLGFGSLVGKIESVADAIIFIICALYLAARLIYLSFTWYEKWRILRIKRRQMEK